jgi:hypothetical protein
VEISEILRQFERNTGEFPRAAVEAAVAQRDEIVPELLRVLEHTVGHAAELEADHDYMAHLYAMFLLAQFRESRAYPLVLRFASLPGDLPDALGADFIADDLGRVLASVCGGDVSAIQNLIEKEAVNRWVRCSALSALVTLVATGLKSREEIVSYFAELFRGKLQRRCREVWGALVSCACDLYPDQLIADIERAYQDDLVDPLYIALEDVRNDLARGEERTLSNLASRHSLVEDTVAEMEWWDCFQPDRKTDSAHKDQDVAPVVQVRYDTPKIGRNEPCPCGSGKKYKKCCGAN